MKPVLFLAIATGLCVAQTTGETYGVVLFAHDLMMPMRDGMHLSTDVYRPAVDGVPLARKLPLLLQQTPYNKEVARSWNRQSTWRAMVMWSYCRTTAGPINRKAC